MSWTILDDINHQISNRKFLNKIWKEPFYEVWLKSRKVFPIFSIEYTILEMYCYWTQANIEKNMNYLRYNDKEYSISYISS